MPRSGDGIYRRGKTWWLDWRYEGERYQHRLGEVSKTVAAELATVYKTRILKGEAGIGRKRKNVTFDKAAEIFLEWAETTKKPLTVQFYRVCLARLGKTFKGKRLGKITPFAVESYRRQRVKGGAPVRANREMATLRALFNKMIEWGRFEGVNPATRKITREPQRRVRFFSEDEESRLLEVCSPTLAAIVTTCIHAGLRMKSEALTLRWGAVDLVQRKLYVDAAYAKSSKLRTVPTNSTVLATLKEHRRSSQWTGPEDFVFVSKEGSPLRDIRSSFVRACDRAEIKNATPHTCRHTFGSRLAMKGVHPRAIQELGGWATLKMVERYSHLAPSHLADEVEKIARTSSKVVEMPKAKKRSK